MIPSTTRNSETARRAIMSAAAQRFGRGKMDAFFEHGHWWIENRKTGAQYSVYDVHPRGFGFEQVSQGEEDY